MCLPGLLLQELELGGFHEVTCGGCRLLGGLCGRLLAGHGSAKKGRDRETVANTVRRHADLHGKVCGQVAETIDDVAVYVEDKEFTLKVKGQFNVTGLGAAGNEPDIRKRGKLVLAYENDAPKTGGWVLLDSLLVKKLTADELSKLLKK